jgi:hypothetical protein
MARDQQGLPLSGAPDSGKAFDCAVADYYALTGDPVGILSRPSPAIRPSRSAASPSQASS